MVRKKKNSTGHYSVFYSENKCFWLRVSERKAILDTSLEKQVQPGEEWRIWTSAGHLDSKAVLSLTAPF